MIKQFFNKIKSFFYTNYSHSILLKLKDYITTQYSINVLFLSQDPDNPHTDRSKFIIDPIPTIEVDIFSTHLLNQPNKQVMTLAHEFGHFIRFKQSVFSNPDLFSATIKYNNNLKLLPKQSLSFKEIFLILKEEIFASFQGRKLLKSQNIQISPQMFFYDISCLLSHFNCLLNYKILSIFKYNTNVN